MLLAVYRACDNRTEFTCQSQQCVPRKKRCDGVLDCWDHSDESNDTCRSPRCHDGFRSVVTSRSFVLVLQWRSMCRASGDVSVHRHGVLVLLQVR